MKHTGEPSLQTKPLLGFRLKPIHAGDELIGLYRYRKQQHIVV